MLFSEIIAVYSENRTKHINTTYAVRTNFRVLKCYSTSHVQHRWSLNNS
jgi:hypothetical protein